jgi:glycosyltransferase involved in cell wall biosynthesis
MTLDDNGGRPRVGYVGQLYPGKGLEIIRELAAQASWAEFHIVGGQEQTVAQLRQDPTLPSNMRFHGFVPPSEAEKLVLAFDIVLAPYQREVQIAGGGETAAWMSPLKLFTYMAARRPIICSDLPVLREIIQHGHNGLLVAADDPKAWVTALRDLCSDSARRTQLGETAYMDFLTRHTWRERATRVLDCFSPCTTPDAIATRV